MRPRAEKAPINKTSEEIKQLEKELSAAREEQKRLPEITREINSLDFDLINSKIAHYQGEKDELETLLMLYPQMVEVYLLKHILNYLQEMGHYSKVLSSKDKTNYLINNFTKYSSSINQLEDYVRDKTVMDKKIVEVKSNCRILLGKKDNFPDKIDIETAQAYVKRLDKNDVNLFPMLRSIVPAGYYYCKQ